MARVDLRERVARQHAQRVQGMRVRQRRAVTGREGVQVQVDGRWLRAFCSNDYLGLAQAPDVLAAARQALATHGAGGIASHLVCGHTPLHDALEREVAHWLQRPRAVLFGSGYLANLGVVQALLDRDDLCVQDKLNHASLIDAAHLAGCRLSRYRHADADGAARQLQATPDGAALLVTDGVFSMDGDVAPLPRLAQVARDHAALLYVDDAHGVGVLGPDGQGSVAAAGLDVAAVPLQLVTLGKALGGYGALVVGDADLVEHLIQGARPYIYTTAMPPAVVAAALASVRIARSAHHLREHLQANIARWRMGTAREGIRLLPSTTPIQPLPCGSEQATLALATQLEDAGFWVGAIRPPTVPAGQARLRITLSALHAPQDVDALVTAIARARDRLPQGYAS